VSDLYQIPSSWKWTILDEVFLIERGGSPRPIKSFLTDNEDGINWIKIGDVKKGQKYIESTKEKIIPEGLKKSRLVVEGDFILSNSMSFGRPYIVKTKGAVHDGWLVFRDITKELYKDFFYYLLSSSYIYQQFSHNASGSTVKNLNIDIVKQTNISLPPLNEQKSIVTKIEKLFSNLDNSDKYLAHLEKQLKRYRQSVLKSAFEGELTREWRIKHKINFEWTNKEVRDIIQLVDGDRGKNYPKKSDYLDAGYCLYLSTKNVRPFGFLFDDEVYISKEKHEQLRSGTLSKGDIVLTTRGTIGNVAFYDETIPYKVVRINSGMLILRIKEDVKLNPTYLMKYIQSPDFEKQRKEKVTGTAQPQLPGGTLKDFIVSVPNTLEEQNEIVNEIDKHFSIIDKLESVVQKSIQESKRLRQSILKQAFEGKLVEQDPNDESAEMLLEKIAKAKEEYKKEMSKRKKKQ